MKFKKFLLFILLFTSCGFQEVEGDKHPEIPDFPKTSNPEILIAPFHEGTLKNDPFVLKDYFVLWVSGKSKHSELLIFDRNLQLVKSHTLKNVQRIFSRKDYINVLEIEYRNDDNSCYRQIITIPELKHDAFRTALYSPNYGYFFSNKTYPKYDSIHLTVDEKQQLLNRFEDSVIQLHLDSIISFTDHGEVVFIDKSMRFYHVFENNNLMIDRIDSGKYIPVLSKSLQYEKDGCIEKYDDAVMGNRTSGNHMAFGYHPFGYVYYNINFQDKKAKTKFNNAMGLEAKHFTIDVFGEKMIYAPTSRKLYRIELN